MISFSDWPEKFVEISAEPTTVTQNEIDSDKNREPVIFKNNFDFTPLISVVVPFLNRGE